MMDSDNDRACRSPGDHRNFTTAVVQKSKVLATAYSAALPGYSIKRDIDGCDWVKSVVDDHER